MTDFRSRPSTTNPENQEIMDAPRHAGNASMSEQVKGPNPWRKMMMMIPIVVSSLSLSSVTLHVVRLRDCDAFSKLLVRPEKT